MVTTRRASAGKRKRVNDQVEEDEQEEALSVEGSEDNALELDAELDVTQEEEELEMVVSEEEMVEESDSQSEESAADSRSEGELDDLRHEMRELEETVNLTDTFRLVDRLGEGTFSSVYKAIDLHHGIYDNTRWRPHGNDQLPTPDPSSDLPRKRRKTSKVYVALKRIYVTSSPQRIQNELDILAKLRNCSHVTYLISAFRHEDQVIAVIPYEKHQDFREYYRNASMDLIRAYFYCLLSGLAGAHEHNVIHRDIKPANFLFNAQTMHGTVCDFGLAQVFDPWDWRGHCLHSLPIPKHGQMHGIMLSKPVPTIVQVTEACEQCGRKQAFENEGLLADLEDKIDEESEFFSTWEPAQKPVAGQRVGYMKPEMDKRSGVRANRAGTRGFRAPEVLFKCQDQTVAIDIWSVGITLLCFLTRRFPFFNSNDDTEALMEIACIFGKKRMEECGAMHNRVFISNVPNVEKPFRQNLHELVRQLNPNLLARERPKGLTANDVEWYEKSSLFQAVDLMKQCLTMDCTRRITALGALQHPFFEGYVPTQP